ncbi:helix-turn-helix transcriptional regulator [Streptomyces sp. NPDC094468]|uniref:helix-turn-helix transcriptional regulator n=1 Tax=Streptomyces sp. NPDC094468 TaxID=3366066 RepID=UPI0038198C92
MIATGGPAAAGSFAALNGTRQVPGLRREEVATQAGISVDYCNRMERGGLAGVSDGILKAVADALRLDEAERAHLVDLARASQRRPSRGRRGPATALGVRPSVAWMIDAMDGVAAFAVNGREDRLAANSLGRAFCAPVFEAQEPANMVRFTYLDPHAREFFADWDRIAKECAAALRAQAAQEPFDRALSDLVGELCTSCEEFAAFRATHDVRLHRRAEKRFHHPLVGDLTLHYERLAISADPGLEILTYVPEPGSRSAEAFAFLASHAGGDRGRPGHVSPQPLG